MKKSNKWYILLVFIIPLAFAFIFASIKIAEAFSLHKNQIIVDENGANDFSLNTLTKEDIINKIDDCTKLAFGKGGDGKRTNITEKQLLESDYDKVNMYAKQFSGVEVVQATKCSSSIVHLDITSTVEEGNFVIIIQIDGAIYEEIEANSTKTVKLEDINEKTILVKIAGESASYNITINRSFS